MAVASNPLESFIWGAGGAKKTPEQVAREREIAAALMQGGMDYSPVDHWLQGAARAAQGGVGALKDRWANEAEATGRSGFQSQWDSVFGGGQGAPAQTASIDPVAAALVGTPQTASDATAAMASIPSGDQAGYIRQGLISRGLPEHVADAFLMNMQDESGLNPGINEAAPTVPGSRGGYGLYQLTGPRRVAYEQYAQQMGVDPSNVDAQLDFMMSELQGPEARAYQSIMSAPDTGSAAAAIVTDFLRPAEEHRNRRVAQYTGGSGAPMQVAQAGGQPSIEQLIGLSSDPWANDSQKQILQALMGQQMQQQDPMYQLQMLAAQQGLTKGDLEIQALLNPAAPAPDYGFIELPNGQIVRTDATSGNVQDMGAFGAPEQPSPTSAMQNYEYLVASGLPPEQAMERAFGGGQTINVGGNNDIGTIPAGMMVTRDEAGNVTGMQAIPGSPAEREAQAAADAAQAGTNQASRYGNVVVEDIDRALNVLATDPTWSTGILGQAMGNFKGSSSDRLNNLLDTVRANSAFDRLQAMRDASPTGGALGAVSERELGLLQSAIGSLETGNAEDLAYNLKRLQTIYSEIIDGPKASPGQSTAPAGDIDALLEKYQ